MLVKRTFAVIVATLTLCATAGADQRSFRDAAGKARTYSGFIQYCNPVFLQGFIGEVGQAKPLGLQILVGRAQPRGELRWRALGGALVEANQPNGEGEAVLGFRCGFSVNFAQLGEADRPKAGDLIWIFIARTADGQRQASWRMFERTVGAGGNVNPNPDKGESQGIAFFQGRITAIRPDSVRGYALDDLALSGVTGPQVFNPVKVLVKVGRRQADSAGAFEDVEEVAAEAGEETEIPLYLSDPPVQAAAGTTWKFGFTANLKNRLEPGFEYQFTLFEVSLAQLVLDRRIHRITAAETVPAIASFTVGKGVDGAGGNELEMGKDAASKMAEKVREEMRTRALISKDEFFRLTPEGTGEGKTGFWKPAPELLYRYEGAAATLERTSLPPPKGEPTREQLTFQGEGRGVDIAGGYSPDKTRNLWVELVQSEPDPKSRAEKKQYVYNWYFSEPWYENYLYALFRNVKAKQLEQTYAGLTPPGEKETPPDPAAPGQVVDPDAPAQPAASPKTDAKKDRVKNGYITIFLDEKTGKPVPWEDLDKERRSKLVEKYAPRLDEDFNIYRDVQLGVGAFSRQAIAAKNAEAAVQPSAEALASNPLADPTTNPSVEDSKIATMTFKLKGNHRHASYDDETRANHPLFVSVRYVYDMGVRAVKKAAKNP